MKVTVMSRAVADAAGYELVNIGPAGPAATWIVAAPDGVFGFTEFSAAERFAYTYDLPVSFL